MALKLPDIRKKKSQGPNLLSLPLSVRKRIWQFALQFHGPLTRQIEGQIFRYYVSYSIGSVRRSPLTSLLSTCSQVHDECAPILYASNCFSPIFYETDPWVIEQGSYEHESLHDDQDPMRGYKALGIPPRYIHHLRDIMIKYAPVLPATYWSYKPEWVAWLLERAPLIEHVRIRHFNHDTPTIDNLGPCGLWEVVQSTAPMMQVISSTPCLARLDISFYPDGRTPGEMAEEGVATVGLAGEFDAFAIDTVQSSCMPRCRKLRWLAWRPIDQNVARSKGHSGMGCCQWLIDLNPKLSVKDMDSISRGHRQPPRKSPLLALPGELRDMVWKYALNAGIEIPILWPRRDQYPTTIFIKRPSCFLSPSKLSGLGKGPSNLLSVNKQIFRECVAIFYGQNIFPLRFPGSEDPYMDYIGQPERWIPRMGIQRHYFPYLRAIAIEIPRLDGYTRDCLDLMADILQEFRKSCPNIEYVRLHVYRDKYSWARSLIEGSTNLPQYIRENQRIFRAIRAFKPLRMVDIIGHKPNPPVWMDYPQLQGPSAVTKTVDSRTLRVIKNTCFQKAFRVRFLELETPKSSVGNEFARWVIDLSDDIASERSKSSSKSSSIANSSSSSKTGVISTVTAIVSDDEMDVDD